MLYKKCIATESKGRHTMGYKLINSTSIAELSEALNLKYLGADVNISGVSQENNASINDLVFCKILPDHSEEIAFITTSQPSDALLINNGIIHTKNPRLTFIRALNYLVDKIGFTTWRNESEIHPSAVLGKNVVIEDGCVVGENTVIEHNVVLHAGTRIGKNCLIRSCSSIGSNGFGFERMDDGTPLRFPHLGGVLIGDNVEIGACTAVARGTLSDTIIENHVKIDNLVHIAHNCLIKKGAFVIACAELSGSVVVGENAWVAPNSCTLEKIAIGEGSIVGLGAVVTKNVPANSIYVGNPAKKLR